MDSHCFVTAAVVIVTLRERVANLSEYQSLRRFVAIAVPRGAESLRFLKRLKRGTSKRSEGIEAMELGWNLGVPQQYDETTTDWMWS